MEECKVCGRRNPIEGANFCYYCGAALESRGETAAAVTAEPEAEAFRRLAAEVNASEQTEKPKFSKWKCFGILCLTLVPVYGWLFLLGWLIFTVSNPTVSEERKEVAKGALLFVGLLLVAVLIFSWYVSKNPDYFDQLMESYANMYGGAAK